MNRTLQKPVAGLAVVVAALLPQPPQALASGVSATGTPVAILTQGGFANCPAFAAGPSLQQFDAASWPKHLDVAVAQPNDLKQWSVDFSKETLIRYTLGSKPSAGYQIEVVAPLQVQGDALTVPVKLSEPNAGDIVATVLTSPCVYLHVDGAQFSTVSIVDADSGASLQEMKR